MNIRVYFAGSCLAVAMSAPGVLAAEEVLNAVHFTSAQSSFGQSFQAFVDAVNKRGEGVVRIRVRGGPEVVPQGQLGEAQRRGLVDMIQAPAGLYLNLVPEGEAFSAATITPWELRENGGWELINKIYAEKGNAHLLAHTDAGTGFNVFTVAEPELGANGDIDWSSLLVRTSPLQRDFVEALGARAVVQSTGDIYTSLERGVVSANVFTVQSYATYGWDKFTRYRVEPSFFQTDVLISMNRDRWNELSDEARAILDEVAREYERDSYEANVAATEAAARAMEEDGQQVVELQGEGLERYLATAATTSWGRIAERDDTHVQALRATFAP